MQCLASVAAVRADLGDEAGAVEAGLLHDANGFSPVCS